MDRTGWTQTGSTLTGEEAKKFAREFLGDDELVIVRQGRPPLAESTEAFRVRVPGSLAKRARETAAERHITVSQLIREAIASYTQ